MNTKKRNIGARLGAMLLSLCLMMGLLPVTAFAQSTGTTIFGYEGSGTWNMARVSAEDQSDYTALTSYDSFDWFYGLEMIGDTIYGVFNLSRRIGQTVGNSAAVAALGWIGYQAGAATQSAGTITGIKALCVLIPAIALVGSWIAFRFVWNITPQIRADMAARKSAAE